MKHTLRLNGVIIGHSELEHAEPDLGRAHGRLRPGLGYELVQPIFRLFAEAVPRGREGSRDEAKLGRYHRSRDALPLELQDEAGRPIATSAIHIADYTEEEGPDALELDVLIRDDEYWSRRSGEQ
jgi:hypothetical protein